MTHILFWLVFHVCAFRYVLDNGQFFQEAGKLDENSAQVVGGQYSFQTPDGETHWVTYTADDQGFHPIIGKFRATLKQKSELEIIVYLIVMCFWI